MRVPTGFWPTRSLTSRFTGITSAVREMPTSCGTPARDLDGARRRSSGHRAPGDRVRGLAHPHRGRPVRRLSGLPAAQPVPAPTRGSSWETGGSMPVGFASAALVMIGSTAVEPDWQARAVGLLLVASAGHLPRDRLRRRRGISILTGGRDHLTHRGRRRLGTAVAVAATLAGAQVLLAVVGLVALIAGPAVLLPPSCCTPCWRRSSSTPLVPLPVRGEPHGWSELQRERPPVRAGAPKP